eukprot:scaffold67128_cov63-Cyclotella_meneghiniana.AAC.1
MRPSSNNISFCPHQIHETAIGEVKYSGGRSFPPETWDKPKNEPSCITSSGRAWRYSTPEYGNNSGSKRNNKCYEATPTGQRNCNRSSHPDCTSTVGFRSYKPNPGRYLNKRKLYRARHDHASP